MIHKLHIAKWFFKIDLNYGYHHIRFRSKGEYKPTFKIKRCDQVMVSLHEEWFPVEPYNKLQPKYDSYATLNKTNDNAYGVDLSNNMGIFKTFNVTDLFINVP